MQSEDDQPGVQGRGAADPMEMDEVERLMLPLFELEGDALEQAALELCEQHPAHRKELERRLEAVRWLLEPRRPDESFPETLGEFRLIERLGGGGMGVVYRAEQVSLGREVALKLIRPEQLYFQGARERFRRETEAVARLQHPGIVAIHTVGEHDGVPFFAMELLSGSTLAELLSVFSNRAPVSLRGSDLFEVRRAPALDPEPALARLSWIEASLTIVQELALALAHAHERGVIHRDVKPSNAMLLPHGRTVLLDFGLTRDARRDAQVEVQQVTQTGLPIGTLAYMSPEQISGEETDHRTDIYSLGVTLFELLTLRLPYRGKTLLELQNRVLIGEVESLRARNPRVSADLETVCLKAMAPRVQDRYTDAAAFARDLGNVLAKRPIEAMPASIGRRVVRWVQRRPALATALALALFLLTGLPTGLYLQQLNFNEDLRELLRREREAKELAASERTVAMEVTEFLEGLFHYASPEYSLGETVSVGFLLERGAQRIEAELQGQTEVRERLLESMGKAYDWLGSNEKAERFLREALRIKLDLVGPLDAGALALRVHLALALSEGGRYGEVVELLDEVLSDPAPEESLPRLQYARCLSVRGLALSRQGENAEAESAIREALAMLRAIQGGNHLAMVTTLSDQAAYLSETGREREALALFQESFEKRRALVPRGHPSLISAEFNLAQCLTELGEWADATRHLESALAEVERIHGNRHPSYARALLLRGTIHRGEGRHQACEADFRSALDIIEDVFGPDAPHLAWTLNDLGSLLEDAGRTDQAIPLLRRALQIHRELHVGDHSRVSISIVNLADALAQVSPGEALELAREGIAMQTRLFGRGPRVARSLGLMAGALMNLGEYEAAERSLEEAFDLLDDTLHAGDTGYPRVILHNTLALLANLTGRPDLALEQAQAALELDGALPVDRARALYLLGWARMQTAGCTGAVQEFERSVGIWSELYPEGHPDAAFPLNQLGACLLGTRRTDALDALEQALDIRRRFQVSPHWLSISLINLGAARYYAGEGASAIELVDEAIAIRRAFAIRPDEDLANALYLASVLRLEFEAAGDGARGDAFGAALARECLDHQRALFRAGHPVPARTASVLGEFLTRLEEFEEAESLLLGAHADLEGTPAEGSNLAQNRRRLIAFYEAVGSPEMALPYRR